MKVNFSLTAIIKKGQDNWYVGYVEEIPGVITQGKTIKETKENLVDALELYIDVQREESRKNIGNGKIIREDLVIA
jgi:predicted RNase H-like HicB family nuclease